MEKRIGSRLMAFCFLAATALLIGTTAGCKGEANKEAAKRPEISGVTIAAVSPSTVDEIYEAAGTVRPDRTSVVASRTMGVVTSLRVREGDRVRAGQTLLTLDNRDAVQRVRAANMTVESARQNQSLAEITWRRYKNLYDEKAISRQEMDQIETMKKVAEAEHERVKAMAEEAATALSFTRITTPVSGKVTEKRIDPGSMASPGIPLIVIEDAGRSHIEVAVDAALGSKIKPGMAVDAVVETLDRTLRGTVREVLPAVDPISRTFIVKVAVMDTPLRSGLFARVRIPVGKKKTILVPDGAIVRKGQLTGVYAVDGQGIATYRLIRTGQTSAGSMEVLSGLAAGDRIVTAGVERVKDGGVVTGGRTK